MPRRSFPHARPVGFEVAAISSQSAGGGNDSRRERRYSRRTEQNASRLRQRFRHAMRTLDPKSLSQHIDRLYRAAWALCGSREDAEDLVQETFARVLSRPRVLHGDDELYYLMRVLRNTFLTSRRTASRRPVTVATLEDVAAADPQPMGQPEQALEMQEVYTTIAALPDDFRMTLVAVDVLGLSYREAARALRVREATITTRLFRARNQVARRLAPEAASSEVGKSARRRPADARSMLCLPHAAAPKLGVVTSARREEKGPSGVLPHRGSP